MHDVPTVARDRSSARHREEVAHSGLVGSVALETPAERRTVAEPPPRPEQRPSDAVTAECTCPGPCIRDHEHE